MICACIIQIESSAHNLTDLVHPEWSSRDGTVDRHRYIYLIIPFTVPSVMGEEGPALLIGTIMKRDSFLFHYHDEM